MLTHYHAVRVLGVSGSKDEGLEQVIACQNTYDLIVERGQQDMDSEIRCFPCLFNDVESIPGLTWPTMTFTDQMTLMMGDLKVQIQHPGCGHTKGDTIVWVESEKVLYSGDLVVFGAALDLGQYGNDVLVLDDNNTVSVGSWAVCYSKRALEVLDGLGCAERMIKKGVTWNVGKIFIRDELVTQFDLLPITLSGSLNWLWSKRFH